MNNEQRLQVRAELARAMEWTNITGDAGFPPETTKELAYCSEAFKKAICGQMKRQIPDPFTNAADNRALVAWMAADDARWELFDDALLDVILDTNQEQVNLISRQNEWLNTAQQWTRLKITAPLDTITLAAAKALGIQGAE